MSAAERAKAAQEQIDRHRGERSAQMVRQARELSELIERHAAEEKELERKHRRELRMRWLREGRPIGPWVNT